MRGVLFCDVDGVLADFYGLAREQLRSMYPDVKVPDDWPSRYNKIEPYTQGQWAHFMSMTNMPSWWLRVPMIGANVGPLLEFLRFGAGVFFETYFVTQRKGPGTLLQTEMWLDGLGLRTFATNVVRVDNMSDKAAFAAIKLPDAIIEDNVSVLESVHDTFKKAATLPRPLLYLIASSYNRQDYEESLVKAYIRAVPSMREVIVELSERLDAEQQAASQAQAEAKRVQ